MSNRETIIQRLNRKKRKGKKCKVDNWIIEATQNSLFINKINRQKGN